MILRLPKKLSKPKAAPLISFSRKYFTPNAAKEKKKLSLATHLSSLHML